MLIGDVPRTPWDWNFSVLGIPVRVNPMFWVASVLLGAIGNPPIAVLIWVAVVFVSILIHEMGHAVVIRQFGERPSILLYTFGGLAMSNRGRRGPLQQMVISFAGPLAGFLLAGAVLCVLNATRHVVDIKLGLPLGLDVKAPQFRADGSLNFSNDKLYYLANDLLFVNLWWGLINLLPVYPLDGGQFCNALLEHLRVPDATVRSLWTSIFTAGLVAFYALARVHDYYVAAMFGYLAFTNFQTLQSFTGRGGGYGGW